MPTSSTTGSGAAVPSRHLIVKYRGQVFHTPTLTTQRFTIGRLPDSGLPLPDDDVSPTHAEIRIEAGRAVLTDLGSDTGTSVAGVRLRAHQPHVLADGARIQIGAYEIVYRSQIDAPPATTGAGSEHVEAVDEAIVADSPAAVPSASRARALKPNGALTSSKYLPLLPVIFQENDFLCRFLQIFEAVWEPLEQRQDHIDLYFNPRTCPASWLAWLASWLGLELEPHLPEARARALVAETIEIHRQRGTRYGLVRVIEICTGLHPTITEDPAEPNVFRVAVQIPSTAGPEVTATLRSLINSHKPAHTGYVLEVQR